MTSIQSINDGTETSPALSSQIDNYEDKSIVFQKTIKSPYTATVSDAFVRVERLKLANEGSAKENIYKFLKEFQTSY